MNKVYSFLLAAALLASCAQDAPEEIVLSREIRINASIEATATTTRAPQNGSAAILNIRFLQKDGTIPPTSMVDAKELIGTRAPTGTITFSPTDPIYNFDNTNAYLVAYHPGTAPTSNVVTWPVDGSTDILLTKTVWDAGKYTAPLTGSTAPKLTFNHILSQVEVICKAEGGTTSIDVVRAAWGKLKKIEFLGAPTAMTYTLGTLAVANGATKADFAMLKDYTPTLFAAIDIPPSTNTTSNAMAMLAPILASTHSFQLKVTTEGPTTGTGDDIVRTLNVSLNSANASMAAGKLHKVTLTFRPNTKDIAISSTSIDAWAAGYNGSNDVII